MSILEFSIKLSGFMKDWIRFLKIRSDCSGVGEKSVELPRKSLGFAFNTAATRGSLNTLFKS